MAVQTVAQLLKRNATNYPNTEAFVAEGRRVTYGEYLRRVQSLASGFESLDVQHQDRVGIISTNSVEYFEAYGACELAGFILALYNFRSAAPELDYLLRDSMPKVVLFERQFTELIDTLRAGFDTIKWVYIGPDESKPEWAVAYEDLISQAQRPTPKSSSKAGDVAYLFYTSGTTGRPKGVPWTHAGALESARTEGGALGPDCRVLQISPAFHVGGKCFALGALWVAGTVVLDRNFEAGRFIATVRDERITHSFMVPMMMSAVLDHPSFSKDAVATLRGVMAGSTVIPVPLLQRALEGFGPVFYVAYGSTEGGNVARLHRHELKPHGTTEELRRLGSVGHINVELDATLLDEDGQPCPPGVVGEICLRSPVFVGYWNNPEATQESMCDGWFRTGDLGYFDEERYLYLVDRKKDMIISGGENIYSREVEDVILRHADVREVAVFGVPDEKWGESVMAVVRLLAGCEPDAAVLKAHCANEMARYKCPKKVEFVEEMPLNSTGKIDKALLRKTYSGALSCN